MTVITDCDLWDQPIEVMPLHQAFPGEDEAPRPANVMGKANFRTFETKKAILTEDHKTLFQVVNESKFVMPHYDLVEIVDTAYRELFGIEPQIQLTSLQEGATIHCLVNLPEDPKFRIDIGNGDISNMTLIFRNSYTGMFPLKINLGLYRLICSNGMMAGDDLVSVNARQFEEGLTQKSMPATLSKLFEKGDDLITLWKSWMDVSIPRIVGDFVLKKHFSPKLISPLLDDETMWPITKFDLYQYMTQRMTHDVISPQRQIRGDAKISSVFYNERTLNPLLYPDLVDAEDDHQPTELVVPDADVLDHVTEVDNIQH